MDPPACTKNQIPVAEKREDAGVTTMHGAQAKTYSGLTLGYVLCSVYFCAYNATLHRH